MTERCRLPNRGSSITLAIEHELTMNMPNGQALPPFIEDGVIWHVVYRSPGCTLWRRLYLTNNLDTNRRAVTRDFKQGRQHHKGKWKGKDHGYESL